jgi:predicted nucleic acid-binding protein
VRLSFDTNILAYAEGVGTRIGDPKHQIATRLLTSAVAAIVPAQALLELTHLLFRKAGRPRDQAIADARRYGRLLTVADTDAAVTGLAFDMSAGHDLQIFDAVILAASVLSGCTHLVSEDLQNGFTIGGVAVVNPFAAELPDGFSELVGTDLPR